VVAEITTPDGAKSFPFGPTPRGIITRSMRATVQFLGYQAKPSGSSAPLPKFVIHCGTL